MKSIKILSGVYVVFSLFAGPTIIFYALGRGKAGMDCSDASWDAIPQAVKVAYYHEAAMIMSISSAVMIGLGAFLVLQLLNHSRSIRSIALALLVGVMMVGYLLVLIGANRWNC